MTTQLQSTIDMFLFLFFELSVLFIGISLVVEWIQHKISPEKIQKLLGSNRRRGYFLAACLGAITPFCSCSTIPMLKGLLRAQAGFGPMMVFLFASPLLNPIIVVLLLATFGLNLSVIYVSAAFVVSLVAGWLLNKLRFERYVLTTTSQTETQCCSGKSKPEAGFKTTFKDKISSWITPKPVQVCCEASDIHSAAPLNEGCNPGMSEINKPSESCCSLGDTTKTVPESNCCNTETPASGHSEGMLSVIWRGAWKDFIDVLPYLVIGIAIGSVIYGYMPTGLLQQYAGSDNPFAIPVAAIIGIPLYIRAEAVIPLAAALMAKGVSAGAVIALIIGSAGASLTELILLRSLFNFKLLTAFLAVIISMAMIAGYLTFLFY